MKRFFCFTMMILCGVFLCAGCIKQTPPQGVSHGLVAAVEVRCRFGEHTVTHIYTQGQKVNAFLAYLRRLRPMGPVTPPPEAMSKDIYEIVVILENGQRRTHRQLAQHYAAKDQAFWGIIEPEIGYQLPLLFFLLPGDLPAEI